MKKEEAEAKLQGFQNASLGFCPLIKGDCRKDCVFYVKPEITDYSQGARAEAFGVCGHYCEIPLATTES